MDTIPDRLISALADKYRIERELGVGGTATVYLAEDLKHHRRVAIKVLKPQVAAALGPERFEDEIRMAAGLHHPHILGMYDSGEADGFLYYVMPFVEGHSLRERLQRHDPIPFPYVAKLMSEVADALAHAHAAGIVHRDIKPENILMAGKHVVVTDFGIAKAISDASERKSTTSLGMALGTPAYMAPEQAAADPNLDHRADLYALGVVGYEMLTGKTPFDGSPQQILAAHLSTAPEPVANLRPGVPPALAAVIMRALAKNPADRWPSADAMQAQLEPLATITSNSGLVATVAMAAGRKLPKRRVAIGVAAVAVLAVAAMAWNRMRAPTAPAAVAAVAAAAATATAAQGIPDLSKDPSIAVLPFENMSSDKEQEYFSDGITEELLNLLAKVPKLRVIARTSSFAYKDKGIGVAQIARELNVAAVLEGSVRKSGDKVRITVQLIRASDGTHLWSETYDRKLDDIFKVQDEIAQTVVSKLQGTLLGIKAVPVARPVDPRVYPQILRAHALLNTSGKDARAEAIKLLKAAITTNPNEPRAWLTLSRAYLNEASSPGDHAQLYVLARQAAERALELDPGLAVPYTYLGRLDMLQDRGLQSAADKYSRALELEPNNPSVLANATAMLSALGRIEDTLAVRRWLVDHDPANPVMQANYCRLLVTAGRYRDAVSACESALALSPDATLLHTMASDAYLNTGRVEDALKHARMEPEAVIRNVQLAYIYAVLGRKTDADAAIASFKDNPDYHIDVATIAAIRNDADTAFAYLGKALESNPAIAKLSVQGAYLKPLKKDPRWLPLLRKMGVDPETLGKIRFTMTVPAG